MQNLFQSLLISIKYRIQTMHLCGMGNVPLFCELIVFILSAVVYFDRYEAKIYIKMRFAVIRNLKSNFYFKVRTQGFNQNEMILRCKYLKSKLYFMKIRTQTFNQNEILRCKDLKIKVIYSHLSLRWTLYEPKLVSVL